MRTSELVALLADRWRLPAADVRRLDGGMNSRTWTVRSGGRGWVAKLVPGTQGPRLRAGLLLAAAVQDAGIAAGAPEPADDGSPVLAVPGGHLALLRRVPGPPLDGEGPDVLRAVGTTLGLVHRTTVTVPAGRLEPWHWVDPAAPHLDVQPWVRPAVRAAVEGWSRHEAAARLTRGGLHGDPFPGAFLRQPDGTCGLVDWALGVHGPLLYDLASAAMSAGGPARAAPLVEAYLDAAPTGRSEVEAGLGAMLRFRWAVQADYFAGRLARGDLTGLEDDGGNLEGLDDARRHLVGP